MFRPILRIPSSSSCPLSLLLSHSSPSLVLPSARLGARFSHDAAESYDQFNDRWKLFFDQAPDLFEVQRGMNNIFAHDLVPAVDVIESMLYAARREDDFGLAVRVLDVLWFKVEKKAQFDAYMKELQPLCEELGVPTRQEIYGQQHLGRYYHGPGEGQLIPPIPDVDDKDFVYGPKNEPPPYKGSPLWKLGIDYLEKPKENGTKAVAEKEHHH